MKQIGVAILIILTVVLSVGCSVKPIGGDGDSTFDKTIEVARDEEIKQLKDKMIIEKMTYKEDVLTVIVSYKNELYKYEVPSYQTDFSLEAGEKVEYGDVFVGEVATDNTMQTVETKDIDGYLVGHYYSKVMSPVKSTIVFVDNEMGLHLDLLEIDHVDGAIIRDVYIEEDFSIIYYTIEEKGLLKSYAHELATNTIIYKGDNEHYLIRLNKDDMLLVNREVIDNQVIVSHHITRDTGVTDSLDTTRYDLVISNGIVTDPDTTTYKFGYNIGITDDTIITITQSDLIGEEIIDATGLIVSPGFIDMLGFNLTDTVAKYKITDGVTTNLSLHGCTNDFDWFFNYYEENKPYINYGGAVFAIRLRYELELGAHLEPTEEQIEYMAVRTKEEIEAGALALAFSPEYYPGTTPEEIKAMMAVATQYDIPTHFHTRYSTLTGEKTGIDGLMEVIEYARELDAKVQVMHLHSTGGTGVMDEALEAINEARAEGVRITYDVYPYDSWASNINWQRYSTGWQERYGITYGDLQMAGTSERLTEETFNELREIGGLCIAFAMDEDEMIQALSESYAMVGSDGNIEKESSANNHFRGAGTFSRILGKYVRDEDVFSLMDGIGKMTINSAKHLESISPAMAVRGRIQEGCIADITIFDYRTILDQSTPEKPATESIGIHYVIVSGQIGLDENGLVKEVRAGQPIRSEF